MDQVDKDKRRIFVSHEKLANSEKANLECINEQQDKISTMSQTIVSNIFHKLIYSSLNGLLV